MVSRDLVPMLRARIARRYSMGQATTDCGGWHAGHNGGDATAQSANAGNGYGEIAGGDKRLSPQNVVPLAIMRGLARSIAVRLGHRSCQAHSLARAPSLRWPRRMLVPMSDITHIGLARQSAHLPDRPSRCT